MSREQWSAVDNYINNLFLPSDPVLDHAVRTSAAAGLPTIAVSPAQGRLLFLLAQLQGARRILEIGTLGGYSTIWLARALPAGGRLITLEVNPKHAEVATKNFAAASVAHLVDLRLGPALDAMRALAAEEGRPFDLIFIDADKERYAEYFSAALDLSRPGTLIVADNVVRDGAIVDPARIDADTLGIRRFNEALAAEPRVTATIIQTVGSKGHDGFAFARVNG